MGNNIFKHDALELISKGASEKISVFIRDAQDVAMASVEVSPQYQKLYKLTAQESLTNIYIQNLEILAELIESEIASVITWPEVELHMGGDNPMGSHADEAYPNYCEGTMYASNARVWHTGILYEVDDGVQVVKPGCVPGTSDLWVEVKNNDS